MYCEKLFESLEKRLEEKQSIEQIASELCPNAGRPREKIIQLIKSFKGGKYLVDNAEWLGYDSGHIRNITGMMPQQDYSILPQQDNLISYKDDINHKDNRKQKPTMNTRMPTQEEYGKWIDLMGSVCDNIQTVYNEINNAIDEKYLIKMRRLRRSSNKIKALLEISKERSKMTSSLKEIASNAKNSNGKVGCTDCDNVPVYP